MHNITTHVLAIHCCSHLTLLSSADSTRTAYPAQSQIFRNLPYSPICTCICCCEMAQFLVYRHVQSNHLSGTLPLGDSCMDWRRSIVQKFRDTIGRKCSAYATDIRQCNPTAGENVSSIYITKAMQGEEGLNMTANQACCACGGGFRGPFVIAPQLQQLYVVQRPRPLTYAMQENRKDPSFWHHSSFNISCYCDTASVSAHSHSLVLV